MVLNHFFRTGPPGRIVADLSVLPRNDLNCGTWDYEIPTQLESQSRV
jgi:hypothetical protein